MMEERQEIRKFPFVAVDADGNRYAINATLLIGIKPPGLGSGEEQAMITEDYRTPGGAVAEKTGPGQFKMTIMGKTIFVSTNDPRTR